MFLVVLKTPKVRFPSLVGIFPKKENARKAAESLLNEGLRKGQTIEIVNALNPDQVYAPEIGSAVDPKRQRKACAEWLEAFLRQKDGAVPSEVARAAGNVAGFSDWTLRHAAKLIEVRRFRTDGQWWTELPKPLTGKDVQKKRGFATSGPVPLTVPPTTRVDRRG